MNSFTRRNETLVDRFEEHVDRDPNSIAVKRGDTFLTYGDLDRDANKVANDLLSRLGPDEAPVAALFGPSVSVAVGLLGAFKAGKIYTPLEPSFPEALLRRTIKETRAKILLTDADHLSVAESLAPDGVSVQAVDDRNLSAANVRPGISISPDSLAWILHTTGSTGEPKGVMHTHRNLLHADMRFVDGWEFQSTDRILRPTSTMAFAGGLKALVSALLHGAGFVSCSMDQLSQPAKLFQQEEATICHAIPSVFRSLLSALDENDVIPKLRIFCVAGDKLYRSDVERFRALFPRDCVLINQLSLSEAGTVTRLVVEEPSALDTVVSVGYPSQDTEILILDDDHRPVAPGETGEIAIVSRYLSQGYWGKDELTRTVFLSGSPDCAERIYFTGDLGRFEKREGESGAGRLHYLGRKDHRVMIRGYQVDLSQIEECLNSEPGVTEAVVTAQSDNSGEPRLAAYVASAGELDAAGLRQRIAEHLPEHMVPSAFVFVDEFPLSANGKIDRTRLPSPTLQERPDYVAPRTPLEVELSEIWCELLGLEKIGIHDNFLELGGQSLVAMRMIGRIKAELRIPLSFEIIFELPTIEELAQYLLKQQLAANR